MQKVYEKKQRKSVKLELMACLLHIAVHHCVKFWPPCKNKSGKIKLENGKRFNCKKIKRKKKCNSITKSGALANEFCPVACKFEGC